MAGSSSQVYQKKRARDEFWNGEFASPEAKRSHSRTSAHDSALISLLEKIDNMDDNESDGPEKNNGGSNGVINSLEEEIGLKAQKDHHDIEANSDLMGSIREGQLEADGTTEATWVTPHDIWDFTGFDDVGAGFLVELITPHELGIIDGDSMFHNMYSDAVYGYAETTEVFYGSLWEDDIIWVLNEHPAIQTDFESPQQEEFAITIGV